MLKIWRPIVKSDGLIGSLQVTTKSLEIVTFRDLVAAGRRSAGISDCRFWLL